MKNFRKDVKMHLACDPKYSYDVCKYVHFKDGFAYATNGYIVIKNQISDISDFDENEIEMLNGKSLLSDDYKSILRHKQVVISPDYIEDVETKRQYRLLSTSEVVTSNPSIDILIELFDELEKKPEEPIGSMKLKVSDISIISDALLNYGLLEFSFRKKMAKVTSKIDPNENVALLCIE